MSVVIANYSVSNQMVGGAGRVKDGVLETEQLKQETSNIFDYIGSIWKSKQTKKNVDELLVKEETVSPRKLRSFDDDSSNWQAQFLSPVHTKLKKEGNLHDFQKEDTRKARFNGVLPFYRVWQIKMEEADMETFSMGRGTPSRPTSHTLQKELSSTKLFLKYYQQRRGLLSKGARPSMVKEVEVDLPGLNSENDSASIQRNRARSFTDGVAPEKLMKGNRLGNRIADRRLSSLR